VLLGTLAGVGEENGVGLGAPGETGGTVAEEHADASTITTPPERDALRRVTSMADGRGVAFRIRGDNSTRATIVLTSGPFESEPTVDVLAVRAGVGQFADIYVLATGQAIRAFNNTMPSGYGVEPGCGRIYWPALSLLADPQLHPVVSADATDAVTTLVDHFHGGPDLTLVLPPGSPDAAARSDGEAALLGRAGKWRMQRDRANARADSAERERDRAARGRGLREVAERRRRIAVRDGREVSQDPDRELREFIFGAWLDLHEVGERDEHPLRSLRIAPSLFESLAGVGGDVSRRLPRAAAAIACGRIEDVGGYDPRIAGGPEKPGVAAVAMRCDLGPSHELHWWAWEDGTPELRLITERPPRQPLVGEDERVQPADEAPRPADEPTADVIASVNAGLARLAGGVERRDA
jgi:hypothetical protein